MGYTITAPYQDLFYIPTDVELAVNNTEYVNNSSDPAFFFKQTSFRLENTIITTGKFRYKFDMKTSGNQVLGQIYRNGIAVGTEQSTVNPVYTTFTEDINTTNWKLGDTIELWTRRVLAGRDVYVKNFKICGLGSQWQII